MLKTTAQVNQAIDAAILKVKKGGQQNTKLEQASDEPGLASDKILAECLMEAFKKQHPDSSV